MKSAGTASSYPVEDLWARGLDVRVPATKLEVAGYLVYEEGENGEYPCITIHTPNTEFPRSEWKDIKHIEPVYRVTEA